MIKIDEFNRDVISNISYNIEHRYASFIDKYNNKTLKIIHNIYSGNTYIEIDIKTKDMNYYYSYPISEWKKAIECYNRG